jgi:hypothetical protein
MDILLSSLQTCKSAVVPHRRRALYRGEVREVADCLFVVLGYNAFCQYEVLPVEEFVLGIGSGGCFLFRYVSASTQQLLEVCLRCENSNLNYLKTVYFALSRCIRIFSASQMLVLCRSIQYQIQVYFAM